MNKDQDRAVIMYIHLSEIYNQLREDYYIRKLLISNRDKFDDSSEEKEMLEEILQSPIRKEIIEVIQTNIKVYKKIAPPNILKANESMIKELENLCELYLMNYYETTYTSNN